MENKRTNIYPVTQVLMVIGMLIIWTTGCRNHSTGPGEEEEVYQVKISSSPSNGDILTDGDGNALYFFAPDVKGESKCEGNCISGWPALDAEQVEVGTGLDEADFGSVTRPDGSTQTTYKGWPLYYFAGDDQPGDVNGDGANGAWFVAKADYSLMIASGQMIGNDGQSYTIDSEGNYVAGEGATTYFTDSEGRTLYVFKRDAEDVNTFTNEDFSNDGAWPVFYTDIESLPSGMNPQDFGEIDVYGREQLTYKGWPVYYFGNDGDRGDTKGVSVPAPGVWPILNSDTPQAPPPNVKMVSTQSYGNILTDGDGNTLYVFTPDVNGESKCEGTCIDNWPVFYEENVKTGTGLNPSNFGTITRSDGSSQTTYKGWPLYYFAGDSQPGDINGDGAGDVWYVAKDYSLMIASNQLVGNDGQNYIIDANGDYVEGDGTTTYFTDSEGRTLYIFTNDSQSTNTFTNEDFSNNGAWPVFYTEIEGMPSGMSAQDFGEIDVYGHQQLTYKGWPVYYFGNDENRGDTKGISVPSPGVWPILNNDTQGAPQ